MGRPQWMILLYQRKRHREARFFKLEAMTDYECGGNESIVGENDNNGNIIGEDDNEAKLSSGPTINVPPLQTASQIQYIPVNKNSNKHQKCAWYPKCKESTDVCKGRSKARCIHFKQREMIEIL